MHDATPAALQFVRLQAAHLLALEPQESQRLQYGLDLRNISAEEAEHYAAQENAWAVLRGDRLLACLGINETFSGASGVAWALLADNLGRDALAITYFARDAVIRTSELPRLEAVVRCADLPEWMQSYSPQALARARLDWVCRKPTAAVRWAIKVGLEPVAVLRKYGAANEPHLLLERII